jgi:hypothetical protein
LINASKASYEQVPVPEHGFFRRVAPRVGTNLISSLRTVPAFTTESGMVSYDTPGSAPPLTDIPAEVRKDVIGLHL